MGFYKKKPVVIEAIQWTGNNLDEIQKFAGDCIRYEKIDIVVNDGVASVNVLYIETLEGIMTASCNDYIIKGVDGEYYPCKPDIFNKTYDEVK